MKGEGAAIEENRAVGAGKNERGVEEQERVEADADQVLDEEEAGLHDRGGADEHGDDRLRAAAVGGATQGRKLANAESVELVGAIRFLWGGWFSFVTHPSRK